VVYEEAVKEESLQTSTIHFRVSNKNSTRNYRSISQNYQAISGTKRQRVMRL